VTDAYRFLARSDHPLARATRSTYRAMSRFTLPAPRAVVRPALAAFLAGRGAFHFLWRVLVCEPLFKAYCTRYGRGLRTGVYVHWVQGKGDILIGDDVLVDGKCSLTFASRFAERPTLEIGDRTGIGHGCALTVARRITIGRDCRIAGGVHMFDSSGHPSDPAARRAGAAPSPEDVRPITLGDNVWVGRNAMIFPGVTVGEGSVVSAGAVVTSDVPPNTVVAGNPARRIASVAPRSAEEAR
jgi:carbonic anhydrase/acetyltransferase-like protein (isoleucine patch superfamily)